jgi:hypothetical protein
MDFVAGKWYRFVDDVQAATGSISNFSRSSISNQYWGLGLVSTNWIAAGSPSDAWVISDVYTMIDDALDAALPVERLGPINVKRLPVLSAVGAGYVPSDGSSVPSVLNVGRDDASKLTVPNAVVPDDLTPLRLKFDTSSIGVKDVVGIDVKIAATKSDGINPNLNVKFSYAGNDSPSNLVLVWALSNTTDLEAGALTNTLPGGSKLSVSAINNLELVFTPISG